MSSVGPAGSCAHSSTFAVCLYSWFRPCRGEVINGGFGLLLDGSDEAAKRASLMLNWDVSNGVRARSEIREVKL